MTVVLLLSSAQPGIKQAGDSGTGTELVAIRRVLTDQGVGVDFATVVTNAAPPGAGNLPSLFVEVGFDAPAGLSHGGAILAGDPAVYYRLSDILPDIAVPVVTDAKGVLNLAAVGGVTPNQVSLMSGDPDTAFAFDGSTGYLKGADNGLLDSSLLSLSVIAKPDVVTGTRTLIRRSVIPGQPAIQLIWALNIVNGYLQFAMATAPSEPIPDQIFRYTGTQLLQAATTYHLGAVVRETVVELYVNGEITDFFPKSWVDMKRAVPIVDPGEPPGPVTPTDLLVGTGDYILGYSQFYDGILDEPAVFLSDLPKEDFRYLSLSRSVSIGFNWTVVSDDTPATSRVQDLSIQRGREDELREPETGLLTAVLRNQDRRFDPLNPSSPYAPNVKPVKPVRVSCSIQIGTQVKSATLFRGDTENWPQDWNGRVNDAPITVLDGLDVLSQVAVTVTGPVETTGQRVHRILDAAHWPSNLRDIDPGVTLVQAWDHHRGKAKEFLILMAQSESGQLFVNNQGDVVFRERPHIFSAEADVKGVFSNIPDVGELPFAFAEADEDKAYIKNDIRVTISNGATYIAQDPISIRDHRKRSLELELPLVDDGLEGQAKADWLLTLYKDPLMRVKSAVLEPQMHTSLWYQVLDREIGDRVRFKIFPPGTGPMIDTQSIIEGISHRYIRGRWTTVWKMSPADTTGYWILGTSELGVSTRLAY